MGGEKEFPVAAKKEDHSPFTGGQAQDPFSFRWAQGQARGTFKPGAGYPSFLNILKVLGL